LVTLTVGRFSVIKDKWRNIPVTYYCERGREADTLRAFSKTPKMLEFFSKSIGVKYPYPKYAQIAAHDFIFGGMENTSATTQTEYALLDERAALDYTSDELVAHELAHQWFGDYLTCKDWGHAWLNESFATYFDPLFKRFDKGEDEFLYAIRTNVREYLAEDKERYRRSIATGTYRRPSDLFDRHLYEKGSVVLFMLHRILGEKLFWKAINTYVKDNRGRVVETLDLINAIEKATGYNMRKFFDQWVFGPGHPDYALTSWWDAAKKQINIRVVQTQAQGNGVGLFSVDTEFLFLTKGGEKREKVTIDQKAHLFKFSLPSEPDMVLFDPDHRVLKTVSFPKPEAWLLKQLVKDKNVLGRIDAAQELARRHSPAVLESLKKTLLNDPFWGVRAEAARAIGSLGTEEAATTLIHCLDVAEHPKVRRAIYEGLRSTRSKNAADAVEKRFRKEPSYFVEAEGVRLLGALRHPKAKAVIEETLKKESWNDVLRQAAVEAMGLSRSSTWIPTLLSYTKPGHHQRLRMAALRGLMMFKPATEQVKNRLVELTTDSFLLMQTAAARALTELGDERAVPALKKLTTGDRDGRLKRLAEEAINKLTKGFES
jgi:aminopeptidase N